MVSTWLIDIYELEHHSRLIQHMVAESNCCYYCCYYFACCIIIAISSLRASQSSPGLLLQSIYTNDFDIYERFQSEPGGVLVEFSNQLKLISLISFQRVTVTTLTIALIVRTIDYYTHFSKNTKLETETSLPIDQR